MNTTEANLASNELGVTVLGTLPHLLLHLVNIAGNILIIAIIYRENRLGTPLAKLLVNQALTDGGIGFVSLVAVIDDFSTGLVPSDVKLTAMRVSITALYSVSFQSMGATVIFLYVAICHSVKYRMCNKVITANVTVVMIWVLSVTVALLFFFTRSVHGDIMLLSVRHLKPRDVWYGVLKIVMMFLLPTVAFVAIILIFKHYRRKLQGDVHEQSASKKMVCQALGILIVMSLYILAKLVSIIMENLYQSMAGGAVLYTCLVLKLPIFLLAFKPYRAVARSMLCPCCPKPTVTPAADVSDQPQSGSSTSTTRHIEQSYKGEDKDRLRPKWIPSDQKIGKVLPKNVKANNVQETSTRVCKF